MTGRPDVPREKEREIWQCAYCGQFFTDRRQFDNHSCRRNDINGPDQNLSLRHRILNRLRSGEMCSLRRRNGFFRVVAS
jgi:hypothetical protein